jgi:prephenate dehydrogenase
MTRLGASPYSMWRDVALSTTGPLADTLLALEQRLASLRENLKTPELREEFSKANRFRACADPSLRSMAGSEQRAPRADKTDRIRKP